MMIHIFGKKKNYSGNNDFIKTLSSMILSRQSIKLVGQDSRMITGEEKKTKDDRPLANLENPKYKELLLDEIKNFELKWLFTEFSQTQFRKDQLSESQIKIEIKNGNGFEYKPISDLTESIMSYLPREYSIYRVFTHEKYKKRLVKFLKDYNLL